MTRIFERENSVRNDGGRFHNCRNKLFSGRLIKRFGAAPFILLFVISSSLAALLALIQAIV